ncbi:putative tRNA-2-methylthio-N(6)-dimethylallyladenosine synthase [Medicago truncatula]|uniref:Putative tRNA-2-methylthio-N(6)-dimethylallyladenosine synthase n=1 Tax=Medicago truncatula TaxID=3880 RepID=G7KGB3_MEDTR|nr:CDK5RAP1-like protein [Medicago truncatula]AES95055.2 radical SAM methylthiotransferase, MiaB/RimO family protein [Medicago truncatula]RHN54273.1 putative tRNA-2-methylthio-N(6)-dimethylallyladenosine synthase [Medicago truncatula]
MASALSSIINQPHTAQRLKLHSPSCLRFFKHKHYAFLPSPKPFSSSRPLHLITASRTFSSLSTKPKNPSLRNFIAQASLTASQFQQPHLVADTEAPSTGRIYHETYGCQMNVNDMEIVLSIMKNAGYNEIVTAPENAEIIFINTCAIRDNAEMKVWQRLNYFWFLKRNWKANVATGRSQSLRPPKVVVLGCMAERLKEKILDSDKMVDVVCGPDAYRDLPRLLEEVEYGQKGINTLLSLEETYADINPVRISQNSISAFVSVMRGCNNMCSFCIVPFTRGRERSRPVESIVREVAELWKEGVKEVTLLGQNVNSYNDASVVEKEAEAGSNWKLSEGFSSISKVRTTGLRFSDLLDRLSLEFPEMRFRFTSPHPKDYPDELLYIMRERHNICKLIHLPAQSGSSKMLERMRRGYTREAYLSLVQKIRSIIPDVALSSDFICGFCGETEEDHSDTLTLVKEVGYDMAYMFAYSMREKTHAHRNYVDDVPEETKQRRLTELIETFRESTGKCYDEQVGTTQLVLVEGPNKRAPDTELIGKSDKGHRVIFVNLPISDREDVNTKRNPAVGDYVEVQITRSTRASLFGEALAITKLSSFYNNLEREAVACSM